MNKVLYNLPFDEYLQMDGVSNSTLRVFRKCPLKAFEIETGLVKVKQTHAMLMGSLTDAAIFEPSKLDELFHLEPEHYRNEKGEIKPWSNNANVCKQWNENHSDRPIVDQSHVDSVERMVEAVWNEPQAAELLKGAQFQVSLFALDLRTNLQLKGRPDGVGDRCLIDLKKVADASNEGLTRSISSLKHYVQAALYTDLAEINGLDVPSFYFIAVEEGDRPKVNVRRLNLEAIQLGRFVYKRDLTAYAECAKSGVWPGYCQQGEIGEIGVAPWEESNVMESMELINTEEIQHERINSI